MAGSIKLRNLGADVDLGREIDPRTIELGVCVEAHVYAIGRCLYLVLGRYTSTTIRDITLSEFGGATDFDIFGLVVRVERAGVSERVGCGSTELYIARETLDGIVPVQKKAGGVRKVLNGLCGANFDEVSSTSRLLVKPALTAALGVGVD
ncbi:hypothetical protein E6O75_ATG07687 [Venturia nashicola]|uniref:Uncharacterized protein n=1 Tax=Venturia nashicola TaxID=86259 RepID=A0A4Z1NVW4_9PEZI|nr:hypothetical protein E6O75_ATG07687 [Venturia nashicola]